MVARGRFQRGQIEHCVNRRRLDGQIDRIQTRKYRAEGLEFDRSAIELLTPGDPQRDCHRLPGLCLPDFRLRRRDGGGCLFKVGDGHRHVGCDSRAREVVGGVIDRPYHGSEGAPPPDFSAVDAGAPEDLRDRPRGCGGFVSGDEEHAQLLACRNRHPGGPHAGRQALHGQFNLPVESVAPHGHHLQRHRAAGPEGDRLRERAEVVLPHLHVRRPGHEGEVGGAPAYQEPIHATVGTAGAPEQVAQPQPVGAVFADREFPQHVWRSCRVRRTRIGRRGDEGSRFHRMRDVVEFHHVREGLLAIL